MDRARVKTRRIAVRREPGGMGKDDVAVEEPLEIRVEGIAAAVTMRTPGDDLDLAAGFLLTEGVVDGWDDIRAMAVVGENTVDVRLAEGVPAGRARSADRAFYASSSCGICGKASIDRIRRGGAVAGWLPSSAILSGLPDALAAMQAGFASSGGLHGAALFDVSGTLFDAREDVGRHNAVDKTFGARLRADTGFIGLGLVVSSRAGFEIVQKAVAAGVGCVVAFGAPTTLAVDAAFAAGLTLVAWARSERRSVYSPTSPPTR